MSKETTEKPKAKVIGENANVFNLLAICTLALKRAGQREKVAEITEKVFVCGSYDEALTIMGEYCELE